MLFNKNATAAVLCLVDSYLPGAPCLVASSYAPAAPGQGSRRPLQPFGQALSDIQYKQLPFIYF